MRIDRMESMRKSTSTRIDLEGSVDGIQCVGLYGRGSMYTSRSMQINVEGDIDMNECTGQKLTWIMYKLRLEEATDILRYTMPTSIGI
jgi:hypothetical protein